jgi:SP family galactose:H+ symporter-like MFS transporter
MVQAAKPARTNRVLYTIAGVAAFGGVLFGFDTGVISGAILFIKQAWHLGATGEEVVISAVLVGAILGSALSGKVADRLGRRTIIMITAGIFGIGSVACSMAPNVTVLIASRVVIGIAVGIASFCVPLYISEVAPASRRGSLVTLNQLALTAGILFSYFVDDIFAATPDGWRYMLLVGVAPAVLLGLGMCFLPRSPRWLMMQGREGEASKILKRISPDVDSAKEIAEMKQTLAGGGTGGFADLCAPWLRTPLLIGIGIMFFQQAIGVNTVIYYAPTIFQMAGFESANAAIGATIGVGALNLLMTGVAIVVVDKVGRKQLLSIGMAGMVIALGSLGAAFRLAASLGAALKWISVGSLLLYIASFAISIGPVAWLMISEIYPLKVRGLAMSVATLSNWVFNFIVATTFLSIVQALGAATTFWLYAVFGIAGWFFCYYWVPETRGHTLEEIEEHWHKGRSARSL